MVTLPLQQSINRFKVNEDRLDQIVNGDVGESVGVDSGPVPTLPSLLSLSQVTGGTVAATWAELASYAQTQAHVPGMVENSDEGTHTDPVTSKTVPNAGVYQWSATANAWKWIGRGVLAGATFKSLPQESGYVGAIVDGAGRACLMIAKDGTVTGKIVLGNQTVSFEKLDASIRGFIGRSMPIESGYVYAIVDSANRMAIGIGNDGTVTVRVSNLIGKTVGEANLLDPLARNIMPKLTDVVAAKPDRWRQRNGELALTTMVGDGSLWKPFPAKPVRLLRGLNKSGVSIDIRKALGLLMLGTSYAGTFSPGSWPSTTYKGVIAGPSVSAPSTGGPFATGDYFLYVNGADTTSTGTFAGMKVGDALVYGSDSAWHIQAAPGVRGSRNKNAWWNVTAAGSFDGLSLAVGDRVLYIGPQPGGGGNQFERWYKVDVTKGDFCYRGEFVPSGGLPSTPSNGEVYQASAAGSAGGFTWASGDYALYTEGAWQQLPNSASTTYTTGASIALPCIADASEWEVRRTDKSASSAGVRLNAQTQLNPRRHQDFIWLISDSMYGVGGTGSLVLSKTGRNGIVSAYGGGTSAQILGMMEYEIARQGDAYAGGIVIPFHGQNNQPGISEANAAQIREVSLAMYDLIGSRDRKALFLSVLGQRAFGWSGSRLTAPQHEDQFAKTGALYDLKKWYDQTFPGLAIHPYDVLIAAAAGRTTPDPHFPGMTEAQVAATYGIVPLSFFSGTLPVAAASLVYQGTWATAGLPTGGTPNDYYIRTANGTVGALLINVAGTWTEWTWDATHLSSLGADMLSDGIIFAINIRFY